jgi:hypothetical protein
MFHLITDPTWSTPDSFNWAFAGIFTVAVTAIGLSITVILHLTGRRDDAVVALFATVMMVVLSGLVIASTSAITAVRDEETHDSAVASWLHKTYGAGVDTAEFHLGRGTVQETTATIDGKPAIIKLARTPDGQIAVFSSDDKPLPRRNR